MLLLGKDLKVVSVKLHRPLPFLSETDVKIHRSCYETSFGGFDPCNPLHFLLLKC